MQLQRLFVVGCKLQCLPQRTHSKPSPRVLSRLRCSRDWARCMYSPAKGSNERARVRCHRSRKSSPRRFHVRARVPAICSALVSGVKGAGATPPRCASPHERCTVPENRPWWPWLVGWCQPRSVQEWHHSVSHEAEAKGAQQPQRTHMPNRGMRQQETACQHTTMGILC